MKVFNSFRLRLACIFFAALATPSSSQTCEPGLNALWSKVYLSSEASGSNSGLPIKIAPAVYFQPDSFFERSKWSMQIYFNPVEASKRENFYIYDLGGMEKGDIGRIAQFNKNFRKENNDSLKIALVSQGKSDNQFSGMPIKMNGELVWGFAKSKGVSNPKDFWSEYELPSDSFPDAGWIQYDVNSAHEFATGLFKEMNELPTPYLNCDDSGNIIDLGYFDMVEHAGAELYNYTGYVAVDHRIPGLEEHFVEQVISEPMQMPFGKSVGWATDGETPLRLKE